MIVVCSGLALDRFTHDSSLFRFVNKLESCVNLSKAKPEQTTILYKPV
jgi:hypothetical protein